MHPQHSRAARLRQDIVEILKPWHRGELPAADTRALIDARIEEAFHKIEQDVLREIGD
jgi:hypothetical protein